MSPMIYKNTLIKIKKSFGRYVSLLIIVLVGVGFYAGIQASAPDFISMADNYYHEYNLMDFKIVSSMGLTGEDVAALQSVNNVKLVRPSYSLDVIDKDKAIRVHAMEDSVNRANTAKLRAEERLRQKQSIMEYYHTQAALNRAMNRLKITKRHN